VDWLISGEANSCQWINSTGVRRLPAGQTGNDAQQRKTAWIIKRLIEKHLKRLLQIG
jgi:hypothetical protein